MNQSSVLTKKELDLAQAALEAGISNPKELSIFMGQCSAETNRLQKRSEDFTYSSAERIQKLVPSTQNHSIETLEKARMDARNGNPEALADLMYLDVNRKSPLGNTQKGDGYKFRGMGYIQLTGRYNYTEMNKAIGAEVGVDFVENPEALLQHDIAIKTAVAFWKWKVPNSAKQDATQASYKINGGPNGLETRIAEANRYAALLTPERIQNILDGKEVPIIELLKVGSNGEEVLQLQKQLSDLGFLKAENIDSSFGPTTEKAVRAFQEKYKDEYNLSINGIVGEDAQKVLDKLAPQSHGKDPITDIEHTIIEKYGHINELEIQRATYDKETGAPFLSPEEQAFLGRDIVLVSAEADMQQLKNILVKADLINESASNEALLNAVHVIEKENNLAGDNWSGALSVIKERAMQHSFEAIPAQIQAERTAIAQLELNKQDVIEAQIGAQQTEKVTVISKIAANEAKIAALGGIEQTLKDPSFAPTNAYAAIKDDLSKADIALLSPAEQALHGKDALNLSNKAEVSALQTVLKERGLLDATPNGTFGPKTQAGLKTALGKADDFKFEGVTTLDQASLNTLIDHNLASKSVEDLAKMIEIQKNTLQAEHTTLTEKVAGINESLDNLEHQKISVPERNILAAQGNIADLKNEIANYDQMHLAPLAAIQKQLNDHASASNTDATASTSQTTPYQAVEKELAAANISVFTPEQQVFYAERKDTLNQKDVAEVTRVQEFLQDKGYLKPEEVTGHWNDPHKAAVKAFQEANNLTPDSAVGKDFRAAMQADYLKNLTTADLNQRIEDQKNAVLADKETTVAQLNESIHSSQTLLGQLQNEQQLLLTNELALQTQEKAKIAADISAHDKTLAALSTAEATLQNAPPSADLPAYSHIKTTLTQEKIELLRPEEHAFYDKASLDTLNKSDVTTLQNELKTSGHLPATVLDKSGQAKDSADGDFGPATQNALKDALGKKDDPTVNFVKGTPLDHSILTELKEKKLEELPAEAVMSRLEAQKNALQVDKDGATTKLAGIEQRINALENKQERSVVIPTVTPTEKVVETPVTEAITGITNKSKLYITGDPHIDALFAASASGDFKVLMQAVKDFSESPEGEITRNQMNLSVPTPEKVPSLKVDSVEVEGKTILMHHTQNELSFNINGKEHDARSFNQFKSGNNVTNMYRNSNGSLLAKYDPETDQLHIHAKSAYKADEIAIIHDFSKQQIIELVSIEQQKTLELAQTQAKQVNNGSDLSR